MCRAYHFFRRRPPQQPVLEQRFSEHLFEFAVLALQVFEFTRLVEVHLPELALPTMETHLRDVMCPAHLQDALAPVSVPEDADLVFGRVSLAFQVSGSFRKTPQTNSLPGSKKRSHVTPTPRAGAQARSSRSRGSGPSSSRAGCVGLLHLRGEFADLGAFLLVGRNARHGQRVAQRIDGHTDRAALSALIAIVSRSSTALWTALHDAPVRDDRTGLCGPLPERSHHGTLGKGRRVQPRGGATRNGPLRSSSGGTTRPFCKMASRPSRAIVRRAALNWGSRNPRLTDNLPGHIVVPARRVRS